MADFLSCVRDRVLVFDGAFGTWVQNQSLTADEDLRENLAFMSGAYQKDILLVEVAYCWRPAEYRLRPCPFPETPEGQRAFLDEVNRLVLATPGGRGIGVFWWEPAVTGPLRNRSYFDDDNNALPVLQVFDRFTRH